MSPHETARGPGHDPLAVRTAGLAKQYAGGRFAVRDLDLGVPYGAVYGFLGPNGAGKTTSIRMLLGLIEPTEGHCELLGVEMPRGALRVLPRVGTMVEGPAFHPHLSGRDNLRRLDCADRTADPRTTTRRIADALDRVGLGSAARARFGTYSLGMKQRLAIAAALLRPRDLLILDEPTNGLDPQGTRQVRELIAELAGEGMTILLSTHLLSEVEQICSHVGILYRGSIVAQGKMDELCSTAAARLRVETDDPSAVAAELVRLGLGDVAVDGETVHADIGESEPAKINASLVHQGIGVRGFGVRAPTLEDVFISLTGEGFDVG